MPGSQCWDCLPLLGLIIDVGTSLKSDANVGVFQTGNSGTDAVAGNHGTNSLSTDANAANVWTGNPNTDAYAGKI